MPRHRRHSVEFKRRVVAEYRPAATQRSRVRVRRRIMVVVLVEGCRFGFAAARARAVQPGGGGGRRLAVDAIRGTLTGAGSEGLG